MPSKSKTKGNTFERLIVNKAKDLGLEAKRAWGSNGQSIGWHEEVDMVIDLPCGSSDKAPHPYKFQVKGRKAIADYLKPCEHVYGQILKEDRHEPLVTIRYKDLLTLFKMLTG